jgi:uncharacterized membrane protein (DUF4010 family)
MDKLWLNFAVALGIGLIIGAERERSKRRDNIGAVAGIRTFAIAALLGAASFVTNLGLHIAALICIMIFISVAYYTNKSNDPGLTTEISLLFTFILGGLTISNISLAASLAILTALLLLTKKRIHGFVLKTVTNTELYEFLMLAAATLIILPIVPNEYIGPFKAINPRNLWLIVIFIMLINALSHLALRLLGQRIGLPIAGFLSGFISSIATVASMGERAKSNSSLCKAAVCGATFSSLATIFQLTLLLAIVHIQTLYTLKWPLFFAAATISVYAATFAFKIFRQDIHHQTRKDEPFSIKTAIWFAAMIAIVLIISAALKVWLGQKGLIIASGIAGIADSHSPSISVATLAAAGSISSQDAVIPILTALSVNSISKAIMAFANGSKQYAIYVILGLILQICGLWAGWWLLI